MKIPQIHAPSFDGWIILDFILFLFAVIGFLLSIIGVQPELLRYTMYIAVFLFGLFVCGLLYRFTSNLSFRWALKVVTLIAILLALMMVTFRIMQPNTDFMGNAGTAFISAIIGGLVCKIVIPDN